MNALSRWVRNNPTRAAAIAAVVIGWAGLVLPAEITAGLNTILGIVTGTAVYGAVSPVKKV